MQSSSTASRAGIAVLIALVLTYSPVFLTHDALAQSVFPSAVLGSSVSGSFFATVGATSTQAATTPTKPAAVKGASVNSSATTSQKTIYPRLVVPSLNLNDPIVEVGLTAGGAMAVPNGKTDEVGLYKGGPQPGDVGSAVLDAHVFAAFSKLNELKSGDSIYVEMSSTQTLHFVVTKTKDFPLSQITSQDLFVPTTDHDLNLITCAGKLIDNNTTFDHRFVVYTTLVN